MARSAVDSTAASRQGWGPAAGMFGVALLIIPAFAVVRVRSLHGPSVVPIARVAPPHTPFAAALRKAANCQRRAQIQVNDEREALEAWDPEARPEGGDEVWRLQLMALNRTGSLRQARAAVLRAAALARTPDEHYEAALQRARIEYNAGDHEAEFNMARRLTALQPHNPLSWTVLRRAARCTGRRSAEREAMAWLRAAAKQATARQSSGEGDLQRENGR